MHERLDHDFCCYHLPVSSEATFWQQLPIAQSVALRHKLDLKLVYLNLVVKSLQVRYNLSILSNLNYQALKVDVIVLSCNMFPFSLTAPKLFKCIMVLNSG